MTSTLGGMDRERHAAVRALLVREAATDRRPVWARPAPRRIGLALTAVAAVAVTSTVILTADPTAPAGYASWSAVPTSATTAAEASRQAGDEDIATQASKCTDLTGIGVGIQGVPARPQAAARRSILIDRRGDWTYCVDITKGSGTARDPLIVISGLKGGDDFQGGSSTVWDHPYTWPAGTDVQVLGGTPYATPDEDPTTANYSLNGSLGPQVNGVDINLADGTTVTATIHDDFWAAWWPGQATTARVDTLTIHTSTGTSYDVDPRTIQLPWARYGAHTSVWR
ncbi:hypothetical protein [Actinoplanes sp. NPDC048796]|uniref:hypothetical protein n=1 Tax=Actinoplanes sp. NPDC048796 TaxID=3155640 RepID=UPI00340407F0